MDSSPASTKIFRFFGWIPNIQGLPVEPQPTEVTDVTKTPLTIAYLPMDTRDIP